MVWLRIQHRFHERSPEWFCAANMAVFGAILLHPSETFASPSFEAFNRLLGEEGSGFVIGTLGVIWLVGLIINGSRQRATSTIRFICAFCGALIYGMLGLGFLVSYFLTGVLSTGIGNYLMISVGALYALRGIAKDKRENG